MTKEELRSVALAARKNVPDGTAREEKASRELVEYLRPLFYGKRPRVAAYLSTPDEFGTDFLIELLRKELRAKIYVPKVVGKDLIFEKYDENTLLFAGTFGVREPLLSGSLPKKRFDVVIVPLVAFDDAGRRLGRGKGYYDRFLAKQPRALKLGVAFREQKADEVPTEDHDVSLDRVFVG